MRVAMGGAVATVAGLCIVIVVGLGFGPRGGQPALAFDGTATPATASLTPGDGLRGGTAAPQTDGKTKEITALQYAAEQGHTAAQWKLGRMYANGDGVAQDDIRAFAYFSKIANSHADERPGTPQAHIVANAFVALGRYYLTGIP
ncbi:MAG: sel1 repeat family protein, partial [Xanthobacteraceae bacterium]